jgi:bacterioferritin
LLNPLKIGENVDQIMAADLEAEMSARALYQEAAGHCLSVKDYPSRDLFEELMSDEEGHVDFLETQIELIKRIGVERYSQAHIGGLGEGGSPGFRSEG